MNRILLILTGCFSLIIVAYLHAFPTFPESYSSDFILHVRMSVDLANGIAPPIQGQFLYYGIEYYLAFALILFRWAEPLVVIRYSMALLVCLSPILVYYSSKEFFESEKLSLLASALWIFLGFVWFPVLSSGLYANFLGTLSMLGIMATTVHFIKEKAWFPSLFFISLALFIGIFSHYSVLLVLPSLLLYLAHVILFTKQKIKGIVALTIILTPFVVGFFAFPRTMSNLLGFLQPQTQNTPPLTWLASQIPPPVIQYMISEIAAPDPFRTDLTPIAIFALLLSSVYQSTKERNPKILMVFAWFISSLVFAPINQSAWRFAYAGLPSLIILSAHGLYWLKNFLFIKQAYIRFSPFKYRLRFRSVKALPCLAMIVFLIVPGFANSWTSGVIYDSTSYNPESNSDSATYQTIQWLRTQPNYGCGPFHNLTCQYVTPTDGRLGLSEIMRGPHVWLIHPILAIPETVQNGARNFSADYVIVSKIKTIQLQECTNPAGQIISVSEVSKNNDSIVLQVSSQPRINSSQNDPFQLFMDGKPFGKFFVNNGQADVTITELPFGEHDFRARFGFSGSNVLTVFIGENKKTIDSGPILNYCDPWFWQADDWGGSAYIAYQNEYDKVWCISNGCTSKGGLKQG